VPETLNYHATVVDIFGSNGGLNSLRRRLSGDGFVDLSLFLRLVLLEDFLRRGEGVGRLRRRRARQILVRVEAPNRGDIGNVGELEEVARLLSELALITEVLRIEGLVVAPVLAILCGPLASVVSAVVVTTAMLHSKLFRHRRKSDSLGQVR